MTMLHLTIHISPSTVALKPESEEIAALLKRPDVDVRVYENPVTYRADSDFWLVFADDLSWHQELVRVQAGTRIDGARFVVLHPASGRAVEIAERHRAAAVVDVDSAAAWRGGRGLVVRSDVAEELPGELGRTLQSQHYASWCHDPTESLADQLLVYLRAFLERIPRDLTLVRAEDARQRGLSAVTVRADARAAGLIPNLFPTPEVLVALSGPPGGVISIVVANVKDPTRDLPGTIRTSLGGWLGSSIQTADADRAQIAGADRAGQLFYTGAGFGRVGWFACVVSAPAGSVVVALGVSARGTNPITAADILSNKAIATALSTFSIS